MSFFDEPGDFSPRRTTAPPPRRPGGRGVDRQTIRRRQLAGGLGAVVVVILLFFGIKGCASIQKENHYKDYVREVAADVQQSQQESAAVFALLRKSQTSAVDVQSQINAFHAEANKLVDRARHRSTPDELQTANRYLVDTLSFRADGLGAIARYLPAAQGGQGAGNAITQMAAQMQTFLASDVIYTTRYLPMLYGTIKDQGLANDVPIPGPLQPSRGFLPNIDWLRPDKVAQLLTGAAGTTAAATPGLHGTGLVRVTVQPAGTALSTAGAVDIKTTRGLSFDVQVQNQGQNTEHTVTVKVTISGAGKPITVQQQIDTINAGETQTASVPLPRLPATGRPVTIAVQVLPVPGEKKLDNNKQSYQAVFTAG